MSVSELRRLALASAAVHDARVIEALRLGDIWIRRAITTWESSEGTTLGHLVGLALDAALLARIAPEPPVVDALTVAMAEAVAQKPHESLHELRIHWSGAVRTPGFYRGDALRGHRGLIVEALVAYLKERGEESAMALADPSNIAVSERAPNGEIAVAVTIPASLPLLAKEHDFRAIADALTALLAGADGAHVRVMRY